MTSDPINDPRDPEPLDEAVAEAAEHAEQAGDHRSEMQRRAAQAESEDGKRASELERQSAEHRDAAETEEQLAQRRARQADAGS
jgi:hypothetical protein